MNTQGQEPVPEASGRFVIRRPYGYSRLGENVYRDQFKVRQGAWDSGLQLYEVKEGGKKTPRSWKVDDKLAGNVSCKLDGQYGRIRSQPYGHPKES